MMNLVFGNLFAALLLSVIETKYLFIILTCVSVVGTLCFLTIRIPSRIEVPGSEIKAAPRILEVLLVFRDKTFLFLVCVSIYSGLSQSLFYGSFTRLINGPVNLGFVMSVYGVADCVGPFPSCLSCSIPDEPI